MSAPVVLGGRSVEFPCSMTLKVIVRSAGFEGTIAQVLASGAAITGASALKVSGAPRPSRSGTYRSVDIPVSIADRATFDRLYAGLSAIEGVIHVL
ncbi:MAG: DUF493 domain-containing protein [Succinivibrionaceae bacterium]|nr:DUF493 domain-containing protein [Succinivibrionaceae bacterium]